MSTATSYLLLGDATGAEDSAARALTLLTEHADGDPSQVVASQARIDLARARLMLGELEAAAEAVEPVFQVPTQWRGAGVLERLAGLRTQLTEAEFRGSVRARDLGEQIEEFTSLAVARVFSGSARWAIEG
ncbi:hypothetical protein [Streptomyces sp. NPDC003077]|uniref:hypothetical protein n=1 Tax=Streptomyces sp. NPDC003077 TaxID=3154443 RepID=UPI0033BA8430